MSTALPSILGLPRKNGTVVVMASLSMWKSLIQNLPHKLRCQQNIWSQCIWISMYVNDLVIFLCLNTHITKISTYISCSWSVSRAAIASNALLGSGVPGVVGGRASIGAEDLGCSGRTAERVFSSCPMTWRTRETSSTGAPPSYKKI